MAHHSNSFKTPSCLLYQLGVLFISIILSQANSQTAYKTIYQSEYDRLINLSGTLNTRDLGKYITANKNAFIRFDNTHAISANDINSLKSIGVRTVIDLQIQRELLLALDKLRSEPVIDYINILISYDNVLEEFKSGNGGLDVLYLYI